MKSLLNGLLCASLLVFVVGCGKDNKSGGGNGGLPPFANNFQSGTLDQTSQQVLTSLSNWYQGNVEGSRALGLMRIEKVRINSSSSQNCDEIDLKLFSIPYCTYTSSSSSSGGTVVSTQELNLVQDGVQISQRGNPELNALFNGSAGTVIGASNIGGSLSRIDVLQNNIIVSYIIDRNYHSLLNPIQKFSNSFGGENIITKATCINSVPYNYPGGCTIQ